MPFKLSTRGHYAVLLMYELARQGDELVSLTRISQAQKISHGYLEQIIRPLKEKGLVESVKGAGGGYRLAKKPCEISIGQIVRTVEGPVVPVRCVAHKDLEDSCPENCRARTVWQKVGTAIDKVLDSITLESLVKEGPAEKDGAKDSQ